MFPVIVKIILTGAVCLILSYVYSFFQKYRRLQNHLSKFPTPKRYPIIGSLHLIWGDLEHLFKQTRAVSKEYGPCFVTWLSYFPVVNVSSPEDLQIIMSTMKNHRKGFICDLMHCWLGTGLLTSEGDKYRIRRKALTPSFHSNILQQFLSVFSEHTGYFLEIIRKKPNQEIAIQNHISQYSLNIVCETAMGISVKNEEDNQKNYTKCVHSLGKNVIYRATQPWFLPDFPYIYTRRGRENQKLCNELHRFSSHVVAEREKTFIKGSVSDILSNKQTESGGNEVFGKKRRLAMLDVLLSAKYENGSIDNEGIREEVDTFIFGGHDTIAVCLPFTLMLLACYKSYQDKLYEELLQVLPDADSPPTINQLSELKYMERCIKESLRIYPPVPLLNRLSDGIVTSSGLYIPKGCNLLLQIYELHHNSDIYPEPEKFDPDRFLPENVAKRHPFSYLPWSAGPRNCIGQKFALLEMKIFLAQVMRDFILEPVDTPEMITLALDFTLKSTKDIRVKFVPRNNNKSQ